MSTRVQPVRWKIARRHLQARRTHRLRWVLVFLLVVLLASTGAGAAGGMYFASQLPPATRFHIHYPFQDARIYDSRGGLLYNMANLSANQGGKRIVVRLQDRYDLLSACRQGVNRIPRILQNATIATEDASFYKNPGFDPWSIVRAAYDDLRYGHIVSGASTITQQLVRTNMLNNQRTLDRKAQEVALAYEISKRFSKRKILWYYLNSVPYGNLAYGAQAAAEVYFHEPVCRLDLAQAALLAGLPRAPTDYNPVRHRAAALKRMRDVLLLMRRHGYLPFRGQIAAALQEASGWLFEQPHTSMRYPQFVRYAIDQLQQMPVLRNQLYQGIDIYTTLDPRLQDVAQRTVSSQIDNLTVQHVTDGALVSLDLRPQHYGWILAMVGSAHYRGAAGQINMAITPRQPGSSMKPFNYIWAFQHGVGPGTMVQDSPIRLPDPQDVRNHGWYEPANYDRRFHGMVTLREALANSLNVPAVKVEYYVTGPAQVAQTAARYGMKSLYRDNPGLDCRVCYAVTLGGLTKGTRLLEETSAYGVFATGGVTVPPVAIWKVVRRSTGQVLFCSQDCPRGTRPAAWLAKERRQVLDPAHAYVMTDVLSDDSARCTVHVCEFGYRSPLYLSRPAAAKTGTTTVFSDNWTVGYTPQIVTGVWAGNADRSPMINVIGVTGAAPIWHDYMENAFTILHLPVQPFVAPATVLRSGQCLRSGSTFAGAGAIDLIVQVTQPSSNAALPLCSLPERGYIPVPCTSYPPGQTGSRYAYTADCVYPGTPYPLGYQSTYSPNTLYGTPQPDAAPVQSPVVQPPAIARPTQSPRMPPPPPPLTQPTYPPPPIPLSTVPSG